LDVSGPAAHPALMANRNYDDSVGSNPSYRLLHGSNRLARADRNHFRNMSSVSIISVKPA
jgi:hypothetical protein